MLSGDAVAERNDAILIKQMAIARSAPADVVVCGAWCGLGFEGEGWNSLVCTLPLQPSVRMLMERPEMM